MAWEGLNLLIQRDAVRENDGPQLVTHWKLDFAHFFNYIHPKYVIVAHRIIAFIYIFYRCEWVVTGKTINYSGGTGRNLPMDPMN